MADRELEKEWEKGQVATWFSDRQAGQQWTDAYGEEPGRLEDHHFRQRRDFAVGLARSRAGREATVLDLGCGSGPVLTGLRAEGRRCVGMDYSRDMLESARDRLEANGLEGRGLVRGDAERLPFAEGAVDCVLALGVISYLPDYGEALREIRRVVPAGHTALITFRNVFNPVLSNPYAALKAAVRYVVRGERPQDEGIGRFMDPREVRRDLEAAGFVVERFVGIGFGPFRLAGWRFLPERASIALSDGLMALTRLPGLRWTRRWMTNVAMFVCRVP